ncbi:MAG: glycosyl transferase [Spirochaetaceae bacterium]|jgi:cellobiose phosphorylase|nr:glycosyl transferase [Spirochaetaceae bacterium]
MKYGHFDDTAREYVIETPATPLPWINYLGNKDFFSLISNTAGGYSFYKDAKLLRLTRYRYNEPGFDNGGRRYYISEGSSPDANFERTFSPAFFPAKTPLDLYRCRHGLGYTIFEAAKNGLETKLSCFVPLNEGPNEGSACEINKLEIKNTSGLPKIVTVVNATEWCLWNAVDDGANFQRNFSTGEVEVETNEDPSLTGDFAAIYHKTEYRERRNHYAFSSINTEPMGFETSRDAFLGKFNSWDRPQAIGAEYAANTIAHGWAPIASFSVSFELAPGESRSLIYLLGYIENDKTDKWESPGIINKKRAHQLINSYLLDEQVDAAFAKLKDYWDSLLGKFSVKTGDEKLDRMVNIWNQYQCMVTFNMSRSASYFESGTGRGMGFRDSSQDLLGFVHLIPERARERILDIAATQLPDGSAWHQYQPLTKRGNADIGGGFNDDPLWLVAATWAYIAETGDTSILEAPTAFNNEAGSEAPLLEHLRRSVNFTLSHLGPHGLPLIGRADWNDCLNLNCFSEEPGESFQTTENKGAGKVAESIFIAGMFVLYGRQYAELLDLSNNSVGAKRASPVDEAQNIRHACNTMEQTILKSGWDGAWFLRAYDANGDKVGSNDCAEGKIYIEPQGMCVMAGVGLHTTPLPAGGVGGGPSPAKTALQSVQDKLTYKYGTSLLWPCYTVYHPELGEISSYPPGFKENGGVFCHNNPWISIANAIVANTEGDSANADEAFAVYKRTCPAYLEEISDIHRTEPYVYSQMVAGQEAPEEYQGEAKNSWLTGTAAWTFVNVSQYLLGIQARLNGLSIKPCLPASFKELQIKRQYRGANYNIHVLRTGTYSLSVDGKAIEGSVAPIAPAGKTMQVEVTV